MSSGTSRPGLSDPGAVRAGGSDSRSGAIQPAIVLVLADDLIWATRLADAVTAAGGRSRRVRRLEGMESEGASHAIVDLTARAYDGVEAVRQVAAMGARVVAVGQHDDLALRRAALEAGAERVFTYRALFEDGPRQIARWLAR
jgi:DNA-binding NarL/FixJ family response regulator